ncbi:MAG: HYR domain-containing protein [Actinomycetota bacterium]|nr:HYR domain-containing protein [Actinomycetota bacterium]
MTDRSVRLLAGTPPVIHVPPDFSVEATNGVDAVVTYTVTVDDPDNDLDTWSCDPASGATLAIGLHTINCTAVDLALNKSTASFTVTVTAPPPPPDTTAPTITTPGTLTFEATSSAGAAISYSVGFSDPDDAVTASDCAPASGSTLALGSHTVTCTATDSHSNSSSASFTVNVVDTAPPAISVPGDPVVEANGPGGSAVNFSTPTGTDAVDGPRPVTCSPESGSTFPLGQTTVTCTSTDSAGNTGQASFKVTVRDTTPPTLIVPAPHSVYATTPLGVTDSDPAVIAFVQAARATDIVDPQPVVGTDLHADLPIGVTAIRFFAHDFSGNDVTRDVSLTVLPQPPVNAPPLPPPVVASIPPNVARLSLATRDGALALTWLLPAGCDHVVVSRSNSDGSDEKAVYSGKGTSFTDQGLENGVEYRYVVRCVDATGNRSGGVAIVAVPLRNMLRSPKDGAQLKKPPKLAWARQGEANYYNLQLFRNGVRIFVAWPTKTTFVLKKSWRYQGRKYTLGPGSYQWYVWPGLGPRSEANYGALLGVRSFLIRR